MSKIVLRHILEKRFGKDHPEIDFAVQEIDMMYNHPLNKTVDEIELNTKRDYVPAYLDSREENLIDGKCYYCEMSWYNCLCSHED